MEPEEMFDAWVYKLHSIARNPPLTGSYRQLSHLVHDIYEAGWKAAIAFEHTEPELARKFKCGCDACKFHRETIAEIDAPLIEALSRLKR